MELCYRFAVLAGRVLLRLLGVRTRWSGEEHLPRTGPVLLASNHVSFPDFVFVEQAALPRGRFVRFMCRHDVWHVPLVRRVMDAMRHVPVDRQVPAAAYLRARRLLAEGEAVCVFPEAGISHSFTVRALMPGVAALARETGIPVVPVAVWGSQRIFTVGRDGRRARPDLRRGRRVDVRFGPPVRVAPDADLAAVTEELGHTLTELLESLQRLPEHRPRPGEHAPWHPAHLGGHAPDRRAALALDHVPRSAVRPTWGPPLEPLR
jgi:1-acyl-sn-glycerol-3-phosphate acyltransferase